MTQVHIKKIIEKNWFFAIEFACISIAVALWSNIPGLNWQPLLIAIFPLVIRVAAGKSPLVRTPFNIPIAIFMLMAGIGVWTAYQPIGAWIKFWLLLTTVLYYFLVARLPLRSLWGVALILSLMGLGVSISFLLGNNWTEQSSKFHLINEIGAVWMNIRPNFGVESIHPNDIAGVAALALPFSIALTLESHKRQHIIGSLLCGIITGLIGISILLTASRGAWLAIGITVGLWILWLITDWLAQKTNLAPKILLVLAIGLLTCFLFIFIGTSLPYRLEKIAIGEAGVPVSDQRFHLFWSAIELIRDVPFSGGSLDGFPGLYSSYIKINPSYITGYSHNIFLDASLEQGILGGLILCWIYLGSILWLTFHPVPAPYSLFKKAILSSLLIIAIHGLTDDIVYDTLFTPLLFIVPGMAVGLVNSVKPVSEKIKVGVRRNNRFVAPILIGVAIIQIVLIPLHRPILSAMYTNLGAVKMAKIELYDFPTGTWDEDPPIIQLESAKTLFSRALEYDMANPRAHYRLGLIDMRNRDFTSAVNHLKIAHQGDVYHRGILKALGLSYVWTGQIENAIPLLSQIPESKQELSIYAWWWTGQDRPDLASYAEQYLETAG